MHHSLYTLIGSAPEGVPGNLRCGELILAKPLPLAHQEHDQLHNLRLLYGPRLLKNQNTLRASFGELFDSQRSAMQASKSKELGCLRRRKHFAMGRKSIKYM